MGRLSILIATVGGRSGLVVESIRQYKPSRIIFVCSAETRPQVDGPGKPCDGSRPDDPGREAIVVQAGVPPECYEAVKLKDHEDPIEAYSVVRKVLQQIRKENPEAVVIVNYTGATKAMSAGAMMAAFDDGRCILCAVLGHRPSLHQVDEGTEYCRSYEVRDLHVRRRLQMALACFERFDYPAADHLLDEFTGPPVEIPLSNRLQLLRALARGLGHWDVLNYEPARKNLAVCSNVIPRECVRLLDRSAKSVAILQAPGAGAAQAQASPRTLDFDPVYDFLHNARRRGVQGRYDDALARLYRALELYAQIALQRRPVPIYTGQVDVTLLSAALQAKYGNGEPSERKSRVGAGSGL